jgi:mRNA-degrading endonuclease RelE of RelBE toxin-antitoxin system
MRLYRPLFSDLVVDFMLSLPKRRQRKLLESCNQLATNPFIRSDYSIRDSDGRDIEHLRVGSFVIAYWIDHPVCKVMVVEVDDVQ